MRRTSSIDVSWPDGEQGDRMLVGRVRDYRTPARGEGQLIAEAQFEARMSVDKTITRIEAAPRPARIGELVGVRGGNHLRLFMREVMPELIADGAPLYLALDDISGTALVSAFAWSQWDRTWGERLQAELAQGGEVAEQLAQRVNICWGLQEGNSGVNAETRPADVADADAGDLRNLADPQGWHALPEAEGAGFRRARRIDVTRDAHAGLIRIDAAFQDSAKRLEGGRIAIHEYEISATADAETLELLTLEPQARILPFSECPGAVANTRRLIGSRLPDIRDSVLAHLRGPEGCTHLNDALRALAEVPRLASHLETQPA